MGAGINLDLGIGAVGLHRLLDLLDGLHRRVNIGLRATEIELGPGLPSGQMRTVGLVGGKTRSVDRRRGLDATLKMRRCVDRIASAHAIAEAADDIRACGGLAIGISEQGAWYLPSPREW